jgi:hypothetical protein
MRTRVMRTRIILLILIVNFLALSGQTNNGSLTGIVYNAKNNEPIEFASVVVWGTNIGVLTDGEGKFNFTGLKPGYVELRVSCVGFDAHISEQILVTNANKINVEIPMDESSSEIEEVVVKTSAFRRDIESPISLRNIGIKEIEKNPGGNRDISKVLQSFPGVASTPNFRNDVIVRGGGSSENSFYLDGVEIPNINHFATQGASGGPVGIINVDFIREVNFYSGAFPADRGNALSSVLDFKQIEGNKEGLKIKAAVGASDMALTLDGPLTNNTTYIFSARRSYLQFLFSAIGLPFLPTYNDFQFKTHTQIDRKNEITVIGLGAYDHSSLNLDANETEEQRYILDYLPENNQWNYTLGIVYRHYRDASYDTWVVSRNMLNNSQIKYFNNVESPANILLDYNSFEAENKFRYENNFKSTSGFKFISGVSFEYARYFNKTYRKAIGGADQYESNLDFFKWGLFEQVSREYFDKKLSLSLGVRFDANNYNDNMMNLLNQFSPRFSSSVALNDKSHWNFNTGIYYDLPPYTTLGFRDTLGSLINKTNGIKYIRATHWVTGFDYLPNINSKVSIEGFLKNYSNYPFSVNDSISLASKGADFGTFGDEPVTSSGIGRAYGLELLYQNKDLFGASITMSYTLVWSEFQDIKEKYAPTAWDNRHILNILLRKEFRGNWSVGAKWRFVGGQPYTPVNVAKSEIAANWNVRKQAFLDYETRLNSERLKAFHQLDIRIDKDFYFNKWSLVAYVDVQNAYNFKSDQAPTYLIDEANPSTDPAKYNLKTLPRTGGGTVLPTVGIIVQF